MKAFSFPFLDPLVAPHFLDLQYSERLLSLIASELAFGAGLATSQSKSGLSAFHNVQDICTA